MIPRGQNGGGDSCGQQVPVGGAAEAEAVSLKQSYSNARGEVIAS
jgi:hypothetical protein